MVSGQVDTAEQPNNNGVDQVTNGVGDLGPSGRPQRSTQPSHTNSKARARNHHDYDASDSMEDGSDVTSSGGEWEGGEEEEGDDPMDDDIDEDDDIEMSNDSPEDEEDTQQSLVVSLRYTRKKSEPPEEQMHTDRRFQERTMPPVSTSNAEVVRPSYQHRPIKSSDFVPTDVPNNQRPNSGTAISSIPFDSANGQPTSLIPEQKVLPEIPGEQLPAGSGPASLHYKGSDLDQDAKS